MIEKSPNVTNTFLSLSSPIRESSKQQQISEGMLVASIAQQQLHLFLSTTFAESAIGSTTSTIAFGRLFLTEYKTSCSFGRKVDVNILALPSEPNRITFLSNVASPSTVTGLPTPVKTSR